MRSDAAWPEVPLPEVIDFREGPGILAKDFRVTGTPLIRLAGLDGDLLLGCNFLDPKMVADKWSHFALKERDILLSTSASLGRTARVGPEAVGAIPYTGLIRMRPKNERVASEYVELLLKAPGFQDQIEALGAGSVMRHFGPSHLRRMTVIVPPLDEQRRIAGVLGTLDDKIAAERRKRLRLDSLVRLIGGRLVRDGADNWPLGQLGDHYTVSRGLSYSGKGLVDSSSTGLPFHNLNSVREGGGYKFDGIKYYAGEFKDRHRVRAGDLVVANTEQGFDELLIAYPAIVPSTFGSEGLYSHHLYRVVPRDDTHMSRYWLFVWLLDRANHDLVAGYANGTTVNMLPRDALLAPTVPIPDADRVRALDEVIVPLNAANDASYRETESLTAIRDALLPKLVSGAVRVPASYDPSETLGVTLELADALQ